MEYIEKAKFLEGLYELIRVRQVKCAEVISKADVPDLRNHHIGMFSAYSEVLNLIDEELSRKK